jgi:hypothetical protein
MSSDADDIAFITSSIYFLTGAPFELIIGSFFLYQLLVRTLPLFILTAILTGC